MLTTASYLVVELLFGFGLGFDFSV